MKKQTKILLLLGGAAAAVLAASSRASGGEGVAENKPAPQEDMPQVPTLASMVSPVARPWAVVVDTLLRTRGLYIQPDDIAKMAMAIKPDGAPGGDNPAALSAALEWAFAEQGTAPWYAWPYEGNTGPDMVSWGSKTIRAIIVDQGGGPEGEPCITLPSFTTTMPDYLDPSELWLDPDMFDIDWPAMENDALQNAWRSMTLRNMWALWDELAQQQPGECSVWSGDGVADLTKAITSMNEEGEIAKAGISPTVWRLALELFKMQYPDRTPLFMESILPQLTMVGYTVDT